MDDLSIASLSIGLGVLVLLSAFFSASETAMMAINRYRLKHLAETGQRSARLTQKLLLNPDRLLGVILLGNTAANICASAVATIIALKLYGDPAIGIATFCLTLTILIFAEVAPKTLAALHPEVIALPASYILYSLQKILYPIVWLVNQMGNGLLRLFGVPINKVSDSLSIDELRIAVRESGTRLASSHQQMLLRILELDKMTVDDVMVPRSEIEAININADWEKIVEQLATSHHTRIPLYQDDFDNVVGIIHLRKVLHLSQSKNFSRETLLQFMRKPYFVPEGSRITPQLLNLQAERRRFGLVVNEYGDIKGLVTVEEIVEEIVGEFTDDAPGTSDDAPLQDDGSYLVRGAANLRDLNRKFNLELPTSGAKTINGLILDTFEDIPNPGTSMLLADYPVEIVQTRGTAVTVVRINPRLTQHLPKTQ